MEFSTFIPCCAPGYHDAAASFFWTVLEPGHTAGIMNIRGTAPCKGAHPLDVRGSLP